MVKKIFYRASIACEYCKKKHLKCSMFNQCEHCKQINQLCVRINKKNKHIRYYHYKKYNKNNIINNKWTWITVSIDAAGKLDENVDKDINDEENLNILASIACDKLEDLQKMELINV